MTTTITWKSVKILAQKLSKGVLTEHISLEQVLSEQMSLEKMPSE